MAAGDDWAGELLDGAIDAAAAELDEWALGGAIYSVTAAPCTAAASASSRLVPAGLTQTFAVQPYKTFAVQPAGRMQTYSAETFAVQPADTQT